MLDSSFGILLRTIYVRKWVNFMYKSLSKLILNYVFVIYLNSYLNILLINSYSCDGQSFFSSIPLTISGAIKKSCTFTDSKITFLSEYYNKHFILL